MSAYRIISAERASFPVSVMCDVLGVSRSGYHDWGSRAPSDRALSDAWLTSRIVEIHEQAHGVYNIYSGSITMSNSEVIDNSSAFGGGIVNFTNPSTITMTNSEVIGNLVSGTGGGIWNVETLTMSNSDVTGNSAGSAGGLYNGYTLIGAIAPPASGANVTNNTPDNIN